MMWDLQTQACVPILPWPMQQNVSGDAAVAPAALTASDIVTPEEEREIKSLARGMADSLKGSFFTSPVKAALAGGVIGSLVALIAKKPVANWALLGASSAALLASTHRFSYVAGFKCGLCSAATSQVLCDSAGQRETRVAQQIQRAWG
jgi:hypothetical protein